MSATDLKKNLFKYAASLGFERMGVARAQPLEKEEAYLKQWLADGRAGEMEYLKNSPERRTRPEELLPGAKSIIALAMDYASPQPSPFGRGRRSSGEAKISEGKMARYAQGADYHKTIRKYLESFVRYLEALAPEAECRTFVDTGPILERAVAQRAGVGFIGKNTLLITKGLGSWVFLASVLTTLDLPADAPEDRSCGECRLCIDACPTQAITAPFELDPRLCIAYLTIEQDGPIPLPLREKTGDWVFGCDICQEVCPHNARRTGPRLELGLAQALAVRTDEEFKSIYGGTAVARAGREGLIRNACVAAANLGRRDLLPALENLAADEHSGIRDHALWAVHQLSPISNPRAASGQAPKSAAPDEATASRH